MHWSENSPADQQSENDAYDAANNGQDEHGPLGMPGGCVSLAVSRGQVGGIGVKDELGGVFDAREQRLKMSAEEGDALGVAEGGIQEMFDSLFIFAPKGRGAVGRFTLAG